MSIRVDLEKDLMDLVMYVVRTHNCNPSSAINYLLRDEYNLKDARSKLNGKNRNERDSTERI